MEAGGVTDFLGEAPNYEVFVTDGDCWKVEELVCFVFYSRHCWVRHIVMDPGLKEINNKHTA